MQFQPVCPEHIYSCSRRAKWKLCFTTFGYVAHWSLRVALSNVTQRDWDFLTQGTIAYFRHFFLSPSFSFAIFSASRVFLPPLSVTISYRDVKEERGTIKSEESFMHEWKYGITRMTTRTPCRNFSNFIIRSTSSLYTANKLCTLLSLPPAFFSHDFYFFRSSIHQRMTRRWPK